QRYASRPAIPASDRRAAGESGCRRRVHPLPGVGRREPLRVARAAVAQHRFRAVDGVRERDGRLAGLPGRVASHPPRDADADRRAGADAWSLVEDLELGRAVVQAGLSIAFVPHVAVTGVELPSASAWWRHQVYWDQNTRVASPVGFFFTWLVRGVPFALLCAACGGLRPWLVVGGGLSARQGTSARGAHPRRDASGAAGLRRCAAPVAQ